MDYSNKAKYLFFSFLLTTAGVVTTGCAPASPAHCSAGAVRAGYFCYEGINFGRSDDPLYRQGVRDGCQTGKGYFRKNYRLSGSSENYRRGWNKGRATCRPADWSDSPTYSYHPLPDRPQANRSRETHYLSTSERRERYRSASDGELTRAFNERGTLHPSRFDEAPETVSYQ